MNSEIKNYYMWVETKRITENEFHLDDCREVMCIFVEKGIPVLRYVCDESSLLPRKHFKLIPDGALVPMLSNSTFNYRGSFSVPFPLVTGAISVSHIFQVPSPCLQDSSQ